MFGKRIIELRKEQGITQTELAEKLGISRSALSLYEIEKREPDIDTLNKLASYFNVWVDYLSGHSDQRIPNTDLEHKYPPVSNRLGHILSKYRKEHNLSELTFSKKLDITEETYAGIEIGKYTPSFNLLQKLSEITGYNIDYFTGAIDHVSVLTDKTLNISGKDVPVFCSESNNHFKARFEELCLKEGIDQFNVKDRLGLSKQEFNDIRWNRMPTLSELLKVSYAFGVPMDYLIGKTDVQLSSLSSDELELILNYRDCLPHYKNNIKDRARDLSIESIQYGKSTSVAADETSLGTGTTGAGK